MMLYEQQFIVTLFVIRNFYNRTGAVNIKVQEIKTAKAVVLAICSLAIKEINVCCGEMTDLI